MKLHFIRHTSVDVKPGICYGRSDVPLKNTFPQEAETTRQHLLALTGDKAPDLVYCSPLSRSRRLAAYCGFPTPMIDERVVEVSFGRWEMQRWDQIDDPLLQEWFDDWVNVRPPGGESLREQMERVAAFIEEVRRKPAEQVAVFCHGGVLCCARVLLGGRDIRHTFDDEPSYGEIFTFEV